MPTLVDALYQPLFSTKRKRPLCLVPVPAVLLCEVGAPKGSLT